MQPVSFRRHRFPPDVIRLAVWLYFRFTLSLRDVEEMLTQRGIEASYETVRCWTLKFGRAFARNLRRSRPKPTGRWHLDEMVVKIRGERMWLWRGVDDGNANNSGSNLNVHRRDFSRLTPPSTTTSMFKDT
jgi:transposase-like protein